MIIFQTVFQTFLRIDGNSVLFYIPFIISYVILFDFIEALIVNIVFIVVFCGIFSNGIILNILFMIFTCLINKQVKEKIYVQRTEVFIIYLFFYTLIINIIYYFILQILSGTFINVSLLLKTTFIQFILNSIFGIFVFHIILKQSKYLERLKKGRNLVEE